MEDSMPNGSGNIHDLWEKILELRAICLKCQGANLQQRVDDLEEQVAGLDKKLDALGIKLGLIIAGCSVLMTIILALVQEAVARRLFPRP
jgi:hypothetical protein